MVQSRERYEGNGLTVPVLDYGRPATTTTAGVRASIMLQGSISTRNAAQLDVNKQMITAIITLRITVIGFYFGSKSASDGFKLREDRAGSTATTEMAGRRKEIGSDFDAVQAAILARGQVVDGIMSGSPPTDEGPLAERERLAGSVTLKRTAIEKQRDEIATLLSQADDAIKQLSDEGLPEARAVHGRLALDRLQAASNLTATLKGLQTAYAAEIQRLVDASAEG